jgi:SAM-dependent methyltransferase
MNPRPSKEEQVDYYLGQDAVQIKISEVDAKKKNKVKISQRINKAVLEMYYGYSHLGSGHSFLTKIIKCVLVFPFYIKQVLSGKDMYIVPFAKNGKMLDVGSGTGRNALGYKKLGWEVIGIEPSRETADFARQNTGIEVIDGDFEKINLSAESFDAVLMINVLEHLHMPSESLGKVHKILKPSGAVIIRVPNIESFEFKILHEDFRFIDAPNHLYHFSLKTLRQLLKKNGFRITKLKFDFTDISSLNRCFSGIGWNDDFVNKNKFARKLLKLINFFIGILGHGSIIVIHAVKA